MIGGKRFSNGRHGGDRCSIKSEIRPRPKAAQDTLARILNVARKSRNRSKRIPRLWMPGCSRSVGSVVTSTAAQRSAAVPIGAFGLEASMRSASASRPFHCGTAVPWRLSSRASDRSAAERARSRTALPHSAVGTAEGLWSGAARGWQASRFLQMLVKDAIDDAQRMCPLLGRHLPQDEVDRIGEPQGVGPRRRPFAIGVKRITSAVRFRSAGAGGGSRFRTPPSSRGCAGRCAMGRSS